MKNPVFNKHTLICALCTAEMSFSITLLFLWVGSTQSQLPNISLSRDECTTTGPVYPNGVNLSTRFIASTVASSCIASYQNFDMYSNIVGELAPYSIVFPNGSAFGGSINVSCINTTIHQTCKSHGTILVHAIQTKPMSANRVMIQHRRKNIL